jgi:hypothetical protein
MNPIAQFVALLVPLVAWFVLVHATGYVYRSLRRWSAGPWGGARGGVALEVLTGFVTAPSTVQVALGMNVGNSLTIRNAALSSKVKLLTAWVDAQVRGILQITSPKLHDNVRGIRCGTNANIIDPLIDPSSPQDLWPQDSLAVTLSGSATAGDIETACLLVRYDDLPGQSGRFLMPADVRSRMVNLVTVENSLATGTLGGYSGEEPINSEQDLFKANTDYALLGYTVAPVAGQTDGGCAVVRWRGADTGNLGVGGPGNDLKKHLTSRWFMWLSEISGLPCVPVFNSANRAGILLDASQDENGLDVLVTSIFAELR